MLGHQGFGYGSWLLCTCKDCSTQSNWSQYENNTPYAGATLNPLPSSFQGFGSRMSGTPWPEVTVEAFILELNGLLDICPATGLDHAAGFHPSCGAFYESRGPVCGRPYNKSLLVGVYTIRAPGFWKLPNLPPYKIRALPESYIALQPWLIRSASCVLGLQA